MKKKELLKDLNDVYAELDNLPDERLGVVVKYLRDVTGRLGEIITAIEDNDYEEPAEAEAEDPTS